jgi:hypothetical protein
MNHDACTFRAGRALLLWLAASCASPASHQRDQGPPLGDVLGFRDVSPLTLHVSGKEPLIPQYECIEFGCPATVRCGKAVCSITHCGKGGSRFCPAPFPDALKNLVIKEWCVYGCMAGTLQVGTAYGFIAGIGNTFVGPVGCPGDATALEMRTTHLGEE